MNVRGIKCDKVGCGYNDDDVRKEEYKSILINLALIVVVLF